MNVSKGLKVFLLFFSLLTPLLLTFLIIGGTIGQIRFVITNLDITIGFFGILILSHFIIQMICSLINRKKIQSVKQIHNESKICIIIVGRLEDPDLYEQALYRLTELTYPNINRIIIGIDGNENEDMYMKDIFLKVITDSNKIEEGVRVVNVENNTKDIGGVRWFFLLQKHVDKREIMNSCINLVKDECDYIVFLDSDTLLEKDAISYLHSTMESDSRIGAVAGYIGICNANNFLSFIIKLKYWFAFNLERSAQSLFGSVSCVGGPLGMYRTKALIQVQNSWYTQTFLGKKCTFGDDRHLTNLLLSKDYLIYYDHRGKCLTETPLSLTRWITQQTRWGKSFYREFIINMKWFHKHLYLTWDLIFLVIYSFFILSILIIVLVTQDLLIFEVLYISILVISFFRSWFGILVERDLSYICFSLYGLIFIHIILPLKLWSLFTLNKTQWGTSFRKVIKNTLIDTIPVIIWNLILLIYINLNLFFHFDFLKMYLLTGVIIYIFIMYLITRLFLCQS